MKKRRGVRCRVAWRGASVLRKVLIDSSGRALSFYVVFVSLAPILGTWNVPKNIARYSRTLTGESRGLVRCKNAKTCGDVFRDSSHVIVDTYG